MNAAQLQPPSVSARPPAISAVCTCFKLRSLARRVTQLYDQTMAPSGLKVTQYSLIAHARRRPPASAPTVSDLANQLYTDRTTLTRNLRPLIDAGYLELGQGADARSKAVTVTPAGEAKFRAAQPYWKLAQARVRELAGEAGVDSLHALVDAVLPCFDAGTAVED